MGTLNPSGGLITITCNLMMMMVMMEISNAELNTFETYIKFIIIIKLEVIVMAPQEGDRENMK